MEFHEIIRYIVWNRAYILTRRLSLFKGVEGLGADDCPAASWIFVSEQGDEIEAVETHFKKPRFFSCFF